MLVSLKLHVRLDLTYLIELADPGEDDTVRESLPIEVNLLGQSCIWDISFRYRSSIRFLLFAGIFH